VTPRDGPTTPPLFEAEGLRKSYRVSSRSEVVALDGLTLCVERGSFTAVAGPSGSGKTTLLALLGALERPTSGRVAFDGADLSRCSDAELARVRRRMGFVFQDSSLIPDLTALENITYPLIPRQVPRRERARRALQLLSRFGMGAKQAVKARELSGGERQRVAIARALAGRPEVVLADEPTSNLDAETTTILLSALRELQAEGRTVVVASHDPRVIAVATATLGLTEGRQLGQHAVDPEARED
jgi:putative ABC transport system ATP-binding protein